MHTNLEGSIRFTGNPITYHKWPFFQSTQPYSLNCDDDKPTVIYIYTVQLTYSKILWSFFNERVSLLLRCLLGHIRSGSNLFSPLNALDFGRLTKQAHDKSQNCALISFRTKSDREYHTSRNINDALLILLT